MTEERYDLRESKRSIKELYPVLKDAHGNVIDGFHRLEIDPSWHDEILDWIKTPTQLALARIIANTHRRTISREERSHQLTDLAKALMDEGAPKEKIVSNIAYLTTFSEDYVRRLLPEEYKSRPGIGGASTHERVGLSPTDIAVAEDASTPEATLGPLEVSEEAVFSQQEAPVPVEDDVVIHERMVDRPKAAPFKGATDDEITAWLNRWKHQPGDLTDFLTDSLTKDFGLSRSEASKRVRDWRGKVARPPSVSSPATKPKPTPIYEPPKPPTTRCPLCNRDGADKHLILTHIENHYTAQLTLEQFITEAFQR